MSLYRRYKGLDAEAQRRAKSRQTATALLDGWPGDFQFKPGSRELALSQVDYHGDCENPIESFEGLDETSGHKARYRCRRCPPCLRARRNLWAARARYEIGNAPRTWFVTLTLSIPSHLLFQARARKAQRGDGFEAEHAEISLELTKWLKRIRKASGARLRFLLVAEKHKSGLPHYHALLHEVSGTVSKRNIQDTWSFGFSNAKLVDPLDLRAARYVAKYLGKDASARVRASIRYGGR